MPILQNKYYLQQKSTSNIWSTHKPVTIDLQMVETKKEENRATDFAKNLVVSEYDRFGTDLVKDYKKILDGGCHHLPNFVCAQDDLTLFNKIIEELKTHNIVQWSKHQKYENPTFSPTFLLLLKQVADHFGVTIIETRLNYYKNGNDWKPYHHDSHAFRDNVRENFTIGISLGGGRELSFLHEESGNKFSFPQNNGDVFAFDKEINKAFMHGVPKSKSKESRISIIAWCDK